jgi:hypothetical protein
VRVAVAAGGFTGVLVAVAEGRCVAVEMDMPVAEGVRVAVGAPGWVAVAVGVSVAVGGVTWVLVAVAGGCWVAVAVEIDMPVAVGVRVAVGAPGCVEVGEGVCVAVGVAVSGPGPPGGVPVEVGVFV